MKLRVLNIIDGTSVDGIGLRTSIYFAGCSHHCEGCHNPQSWNPDGGYDISVDELMERIAENDLDVTFSGGDPMLQIDQVTELARRVKTLGKNLWCYTGYSFEAVKSSELSKILPYVDVIVDGRFVKDQRDVTLRFRGSANQRVIDVQKSLGDEIVTLY
ncbi:MAG: anaerobic ribonucleoside-triphosphate reductase activating protein [Muribaculaceae bacterium]|nr:anaerobic ribonucleoside-triphosphate reductase activating protein [Muribaculaceae bacterium]